MRFWRFALNTDALYELARSSVDAALALAGVTCIQAAASAPRDSKGRIMLAIGPDTPGYDLLLIQLDALSSTATEITKAEYIEGLEPVAASSGGGASSWGAITGKPSTFPPDAHAHGNITNVGAIGTASGLPIVTTTNGVLVVGAFGVSAGQFCQGNDARLSDARTPSAHTHGNITNVGAIGATSGLPIITTTSGVLTVGAFGVSAGQFCQGNDSRLSDARTPSSHVHGNLTNAGAIGTASGLPVITTTSGVLTVGAFGVSAGQFCQGNDARLSDARTPTSHVHGNITNVGAIGSLGDKIAVTTTSGVLTTADVGTGLSLSAGSLSSTGPLLPSQKLSFTRGGSAPSGWLVASNVFSSTIPTGAKRALVYVWGGGGGGGGGGRRATSTNFFGGGGGASGCFTDVLVDVSLLNGQTVEVYCGSGGAGGAGGTTTDGTSGSTGSNGERSYVRVGTSARYHIADGGLAGGGGTTFNGTGGSTAGANNIGGRVVSVNGGQSLATGGGASGSGAFGGTGGAGAGGGGCQATNVAVAGGLGLPARQWPTGEGATSSTSGFGGTAAGGAAGGGAGASGSQTTGGGGGGANATGAGGAGGSGGTCAGGGGGGCGTGASGGNGGDGGNGIAEITYYF